MKVWLDKMKREAIKQASLELVIASAGGMKRKGGGSLTLKDFTPVFARENKTQQDKEQQLKGFLVALANRSKKPK
jgi:hypothetical protein